MGGGGGFGIKMSWVEKNRKINNRGGGLFGTRELVCVYVLSHPLPPNRGALIIHCTCMCMYVYASVCISVCIRFVFVCVCMCIYVCVYVFKCGWIYGVDVGQPKTSYLTWRLQGRLQLMVEETFRCYRAKIEIICEQGTSVKSVRCS